MLCKTGEWDSVCDTSIDNCHYRELPEACEYPVPIVLNTDVFSSINAHTQPFYGLDYPGGPVPEETFTHSHLKCVVGVCHHSGFYEAWER